MNTIPNPDSWMDVLTIIAVSAIVAVPSLLSLRNGKSIKKVQDQVVNGHKTPLREDMDKMRESLKEMRTDIREDMSVIKSELTDIRSEIRYEHAERLRLDTKFEEFRTKGRSA